MKKFLTILFLSLLLINPLKADDITDFQIEGISVGDSLLDYMSVDQIKKELRSTTTFHYPKKYRNKKFSSIGVKPRDLKIPKKFEVYDSIGVIIDSNSTNYEIYALEGTLIWKNGDIKDCYKKQTEVANYIQETIDGKLRRNVWFEKERLKKHQLSVKYIDLFAGNRRPFQLVCYDINRNGFKYNSLYVAVDSEVFVKFLEFKSN